MTEITIPYFWLIDALLFGLISGMWICHGINRVTRRNNMGPGEDE